MAAQWGDSRYPPFAPPGPYPPNGQPVQQPYVDPRRQYVPQPPSGFYNPALPQPQPGYASNPPPPIAIPTPSIPSILQPGSGGAYRTVNRTSSRADIGDLFFGGAPSFPVPEFPSGPIQPGPRTSSLGAPPLKHTVSAPPAAPPIPRKPDFTQPPLPPKPSYNPPLPTAPPVLDGYSHFQQHVAPSPPPPIPAAVNEDEEFRRAIEQSEREAQARRRREDEELARAVQESLRVNGAASVTGDSNLSSSPTSYGFPVSAPPLHNAPSNYFGSPEQMSVPIPGPSTVSSPGPSRSRADSAKQVCEDEELARRLADEELQQARRAEEQQEQLVRLREEEAKRLREEQEQMKRLQQEQEEARRAQEQRQQSQGPSSKARMDAPAQVHRVVNASADDGLPQYSEVIPSTSAGPSVQKKPSVPILTRPHSASASVARPHSSFEFTPNLPHSSASGMYRSTSASAVPNQLLDPSVVHNIRTGRSPSVDSATRPGSNASSPTDSPSVPSRSPVASRPAGRPLPPVDEGSESVVSGSSVTESGHSQSSHTASPAHTNDSSASRPPPPVGPVPSSQFVDPQLLLGLTMGFFPPVITPQLEPYKERIPNVIALPYGRSPPLHIKAPNWRELVRLMALLSETRVEPNIEAQAVVKTAMHLRVVINFVKLHATSLDWHVILYLTIDLPVPNEQRFNKYRNISDPSILPYSYTLSPTPTHLREAADSPLQKWYSIPATSTNPFVTLPVSFPDLAQYLIVAVEESRRAVSDRTTGMGRLAKCIDMFYPNKGNGGGPIGSNLFDEREEREGGGPGIRERVGRFFGIGQSGQAARPANDDRATLVTPFYADNYGR